MIKISDAELEVMKVIWTRGEITSNEIIEELKDYSWNFNTIRTLIKRLHKKGAIDVVGKKGKAYTYKAMLEESKYKNELTLDLLNKLYNNSINEFILDYCRNAEAESAEDIQKIIKDIMDKMD